MRQIQKSDNAPESLRELTPPASPDHIIADHYKGADVKARLMADHHSKCAYCECRLNGDFGHIEHFRPKAGYSVPPDKTLFTPGYYWLAYNWANLLLSCSKCNTSYKANHFALEDESKRDIARRDISHETPLLINPALQNPQQHIEFHQHIAAPKIIDGKESAQGVYTIELLQLNHRTDLVHYRRETWEKYQHWKSVKAAAEELIRRDIETERGLELLRIADTEIEMMKSNAAEYSGMFI